MLVLDNGKIKEFAAPSELLQQPDSAFYGLAKDAGLVTWERNHALTRTHTNMCGRAKCTLAEDSQVTRDAKQSIQLQMIVSTCSLFQEQRIVLYFCYVDFFRKTNNEMFLYLFQIHFHYLFVVWSTQVIKPLLGQQGNATWIWLSRNGKRILIFHMQQFYSLTPLIILASQLGNHRNSGIIYSDLIFWPGKVVLISFAWYYL